MSHHITSHFDRVFDQATSQDDLFDYVKESVENVVNGFNCTIFAYGQTGSGKTYSMFGKGFDYEQQFKKQTRPTQNIDWFLS